jgi:hypothetical protein
VDAQQVVEGGGGINECCADGITVLYWWLSVFLEVMQQGLPGFAEFESPPISVDVIWMRLNFDGFSDETIHVADFLMTPGKYSKENILHEKKCV